MTDILDILDPADEPEDIEAEAQEFAGQVGRFVPATYTTRSVDAPGPRYSRAQYALRYNLDPVDDEPQMVAIRRVEI
jgi:hypothetical protein